MVKKQTPRVNVKNAVRIKNPPADPVLVRNVDDGPHEPIQIPGAINFDVNGNVNHPVFPVPEGKLFVIEYVSARMQVQPGVVLDQFEIWTSNAAGNLPHFMIATPQGKSGVSLISQPVRFYAGPNTMVSIFVRSTTQKAVGSGSLSLSGYLVDFP